MRFINQRWGLVRLSNLRLSNGRAGQLEEARRGEEAKGGTRRMVYYVCT